MDIKQINMQEMNVADINASEYNPRKKLTPDDKTYQRLKNSILTFGYIDPLIYNKRTDRLVGGHQRLQILKDLDVEKVHVSVVDLDDISEKDLNVRLNRVQGEFEPDKLVSVIEDLKKEEANLDDIGFDEQEFDDLIRDMEIENRESAFDSMIEEEDDLNHEHMLNDVYTNENRDTTGSGEDVPFEPAESDMENMNADEQEGEEDEDEETTEYFTVTFPVDYDQREIINGTIRKAKKDFNVTTTTEAMLQICIRYMNKQ